MILSPGFYDLLFTSLFSSFRAQLMLFPVRQICFRPLKKEKQQPVLDRLKSPVKSLSLVRKIQNIKGMGFKQGD